MTAYRQGPAAAGLPFPRKALGVYTALAIVAASVLLFLPGMFASPHGWMMFKEGGVLGMGLILFLSLASAIAIGTLGAFAVRGKRMPMMILPAIPALPLLAGVLFMLLGVKVVFGAISGEPVDPSQRMRIAAEGIAEADAALVFGCLVGGVACGAAAIALLGSAASVDRAQTGAPAKGLWLGSLIAGIVGTLVMLVLHVTQKALWLPVVLVFPSLVLLTALASVASRHGALIRNWHDKAEANAWLSSLLAAAILATLGIILLDLAGSYMAERNGLGAVSGESVDPSQRARILAEAISEGRAATLYMIANGVFVFALVAVGVIGGIGKGPDGSTRSPLGAPAFVALGTVLLFVIALSAARGWIWSTVAGNVARAESSPPGIELPLVTSVSGYDVGDSGPELLVSADGKNVNTPTLTYSKALVVYADRRAKWSAVAKHVRTALATKGARPVETLAFVVTPREKPDLTPLGRYAPFVGRDVDTIKVYLAPSEYQLGLGGERRIRPRESDDMQSVIDQMTTSGDRTRLLLLPPEGVW